MVFHWIIPAVREHKQIVEIGAGGGRWIITYLAAIDHAYLVDGTTASEKLIGKWYEGPFDFIVSEDGKMPSISDQMYIFSFDVFVHFEKELFDSYIEEVGRILLPGGRFHFNFAHKESATKELSYEWYEYREHEEIRELLEKNGMELSERAIPIGGFGSLLVEVIKVGV